MNEEQKFYAKSGAGFFSLGIMLAGIAYLIPITKPFAHLFLVVGTAAGIIALFNWFIFKEDNEEYLVER